MKYIIYKLTNGEITRRVRCSSVLIADNIGEGEGYLEPPHAGEEAFEATHYVDTTSLTLVQKAPMDLGVVVNGLVCTISNIPEGAFVLCDFNPPTAVSGGVVEIEFESPGRYSISITPRFTMLSEMLEVEVG